MEAMSGVQNVLEPSQDNGWIIHSLAHTMAEDVVHSATYYESSSTCLPVQERLVEKLASQAIIAAVRKPLEVRAFGPTYPLHSAQDLCPIPMPAHPQIEGRRLYTVQDKGRFIWIQR